MDLSSRAGSRPGSTCVGKVLGCLPVAVIPRWSWKNKTRGGDQISTSRDSDDLSEGETLRSGFHRRGIDIDAATVLIEADFPFDQGENGVIAAQADIAARTPFRPTLTNDDVARDDEFTAELLNPQPLAVGFAPVPCGALPLLVSHFFSNLSKTNSGFVKSLRSIGVVRPAKQPRTREIATSPDSRRKCTVDNEGNRKRPDYLAQFPQVHPPEHPARKSLLSNCLQQTGRR